MQVYALDKKGERVFVANAVRGADYSCVECHQTLRLRGGTSQRAHFFHLKTPATCHLAAKSFAHLAIQGYIQHIIVGGEQEVRFQEIGRIADVVSFSQKIVFEVQCSFITTEEIAQRIADYRSIGWEVIWVLHDALYKKKQRFLTSHCHYCASVTKNGVNIYDELRVRGNTLYKQTVDLSSTYSHSDFKSQTLLPQEVTTRFSTWNLMAKNDLLFSLTHTTNEFLLKKLHYAALLEKEQPPTKNLFRTFTRIASAVWQMILYKMG